ncbi:VIN3-like protein [Actinidia chinensis var. chinensis]|uniref:VIN3-like protein n=1 Tax=Actinidia chinensis var. chinensis TaxID=1590841 RepID=A0A2R6S1U7_ACTCC|nr:VIN3-like protein [Actinidia chinensis var. chinensis]
MNSSSFEGVVLDPSKCSELSMEEKRELVYELSKWSHASEMLQSWSRQEILQILCAEMGKERKYTGLTKLKIIENLLKIVSEKKSQGHETAANVGQPSSPAVGQRASKRQRKIDHPNRIPAGVDVVLINDSDSDIGGRGTIYCKNSACRAKLCHEDKFCKRCSCCICYQYDDNKDPSLWLICSSEPPFQGDSCGMSCHLECALRHGKSRIGKNGMDGSFFCVSCGKVNDLLGSWRKQLITAKETRRVEILCYRVSLSQKLLVGTKCYRKLYEIIDEAAKMLEAEVGPFTGLPVKTARGIVNRLSSGPEVQRLCAFAIESLDLMLSDTSCHVSSNHVIEESNLTASNIIRFEDVRSSSLTVILGSEDSPRENISCYTLWHRKAEDMDYPAEPTCTLFTPKTRFLLSGLSPATEYVFKVFYFDKTRELGTCEVQFRTGTVGDEVSDVKNTIIEISGSLASNSSSLSNPSSVEDETNIAPGINDNENREDNSLIYSKKAENFVSAKLCNDVIDSAGTGQRGTSRNSASLLGAEKSSFPKREVLNFANKDLPEGQTVVETSTDNGSNPRVHSGTKSVPFVGSSEAELPITPCKVEKIDGMGRNGKCKPSNKDLDSGSGREEGPQAGSSSKKMSGERQDEEHSGNGSRDFEHYVKVIRWLECEGHIETTFRQKFLTWYSLRATPQEVRVVKVFIDTLIDDAASLAEQLVDAFSEAVSSKRSSVVPSGFCLKLWH